MIMIVSLRRAAVMVQTRNLPDELGPAGLPGQWELTEPGHHPSSCDHHPKIGSRRAAPGRARDGPRVGVTVDARTRIRDSQIVQLAGGPGA